ncbi:MAG: hypothetical protein JKX72_04220 [Robiginitomaculum sp.]|nr:hypothetical protein [Robiginitomaculum sp.]
MKTWDTTYDEVENIIGAKLPTLARDWGVFWKWSKSHPETGSVRHALQLADWETRRQIPLSNTLRFISNF